MISEQSQIETYTVIEFTINRDDVFDYKKSVNRQFFIETNFCDISLC